VVLSKADLVTAEEGEQARQSWQQRMGEDVPVLLTSSVTRQGLDELATELLRRIPLAASDETAADDGAGQRTGAGDAPEDLPEHRVFRPAPRRGFKVTEVDDGSFLVEGENVEKLVARYDLDNEDALQHLERRLRGMGVIRALEAAGFEPGDEVEIAGVVFDLDP
jgi:GTP-binding protein